MQIVLACTVLIYLFDIYSILIYVSTRCVINVQPCGVDYELKAYVADGPDDKLHKRNSVQLAIRKLTYAPEEPAPQPTAEVVKDFIISSGSLRLEATLDKEVCSSEGPMHLHCLAFELFGSIYQVFMQRLH